MEEEEEDNLFLKRSPTVRPEIAPFQIVHDGHTYKYIETCSTKKLYIYICKEGYNRHIKNEKRCHAKIGVPFFYDGGISCKSEIIVLKKYHTCNPEESHQMKFFNEIELRRLTEEIYLSKNPLPTPSQLLSILYQKIEDETPKGLDKQEFSEAKVKFYYSFFAKKYNKIDEDFTNKIKTRRNTPFELFKYRYNDPSSPSKDLFIICYCSDFQMSCINASSYIFIDGTIDVASKDFAQLVVILGQTQKMNLPLTYLLLPVKKEETYHKALQI